MKIERTDQLDALHYDERGLIPVVSQHATTGEVLMVAWANREALERTLGSGGLWLYSRSRQRLWQKGESSGNSQQVLELHADCDADTVLAYVLPAGPACHTGARNCFEALPTLPRLAELIDQRTHSAPQTSYTARLLHDANLRLKKLGEEATELALACQLGSAERVKAEAADLVYHLLVAAAASGVRLEGILAELDERFRSSAAAQLPVEKREVKGSLP
jgi:phosphoribosyl-AMP cyclohydrolase / phosphoribosyl-ATP pyrophosphohydrolase